MQLNQDRIGFCVLIVSFRVVLCQGVRGGVMYEVCGVIKVTSVTLPLIVYLTFQLHLQYFQRILFHEFSITQ